MLARVEFVVVWVILLFLPAVALSTSILIRATILIVIDELSASPVRALILRIEIELVFPSVVLPVVRKNTLVSLMVVLIVWTPNCLEMEYVKV
jgi:hypothetical protein